MPLQLGDVAPDFDTHRRQMAAAVAGRHESNVIRDFVERFLRPRGLARPATPFMVQAIESFVQAAAAERGPAVTETHS